MTDITQGIGSEFITVNELADYIRVKPIWVYQKTRKGEIPHLKIGKMLRFRRSTIEEWLKSKEVGNE
jgi:excisionase family DNA binding protein